MCLKGLMATAFVISVPLDLLRLMGISVPSLHRESTHIVSFEVFYVHANIAGHISAIPT